MKHPNLGVHQTGSSSNPIGVFFDPRRVFEAHRAGEDFAAIQAAIRADRYPPMAAPDIGLPAAEPAPAS